MVQQRKKVSLALLSIKKEDIAIAMSNRYEKFGDSKPRAPAADRRCN
jgi:hypothetical protein